MSSLAQIKARIGACEGKNEEYSYAIEKAEQDYENLINFQREVETAQICFSTNNNGKIVALSKVKELSQNNNIAKQYYRTMYNLAYEKGSLIIRLAFGFFLERIMTELNNIRDKIQEYNNLIAANNRKIEVYEKIYEKEKAELEKEI